MGFGAMTFPVFIKNMPPNMKFKVIEIKSIRDNHKWGDHIISAQVPFEPEVGHRAFEVSVKPDPYLSGKPPSFEIRFEINGTSPSGKTDTRGGYITIEMTEWGYFTRPNNATITFVFDGSAPHSYVYNTPTLTYLDDVSVILEWLPKENAVGMTISMDKTTIKWLCEQAIGGILAGHEKAASWAIGKAW